MSATFGPGVHGTPGRAVDASAYDQWTGRWSRLFAPSLLVAAKVAEVERVRREDAVESFDEYWAPIEAGIGSIPKVYFTLADADRHPVRDKVRARLTQYEQADGKLRIGIEMLIASGRA